MTGSPPKPAPQSPPLIPLEDVTELEALPPSQLEQPANQGTSSPESESLLRLDALSSQLSPENIPQHVASSPKRDSEDDFSLEGSFGQPPTNQSAAKYVTVSAILSRSGAVFPVGPHSEANDHLFRLRHSREQPHDAPPSTLRKRRQSKGTSGAAFSSGNALEAIGALWLHRDNKGRATSLSSQRWLAGDRDDQGSSTHPNAGHTTSLISSYRAFLNAVKDVGTSTLGLHMPSAASSSSLKATGSETIAERRQRKRLQQTGEVVATEGDTIFVRIKTRKNQPTFDVGQSLPPSPEPKKSRKNSVSDPVADPRAAFRRVHSSAYPRTYGVGSSFGPQDPLDAPPSPVGMPGDWPGGKGWRSLAAVGHEDAALLLPPPLLDDHGSSPQSFEGLLGVKRMRQQEAARKRLQQLAARNRPAHQVGMLTALTNFVRAAHAADQATKATRRSPAHQRPGAPTRRHTEHFETLREDALRNHSSVNADQASMDEGNSALAPPSNDQSPVSLSKASRRSSIRTSLDSVTGPLQTVLEGDACLAESSDSSYPPQVSATRRSSLLVRQEPPQPQAPRLLPIQFLPEPSPLMTRQTSDSAGHTDYLSARPFPNGSSTEEKPPATPRAPRIGPTTLELPPSPWTSLDAGDNHFYSLSLSRSGIPGTPRLAPTHLSVLPSPFPSAAPSRLGSPRPFLTHSPTPMKAGEGTALVASPIFQPLDGSPLVTSFDQGRRGSTASAKRRRGSRLTPANMLGASGHSSAVENAKQVDNSVGNTLVNGSADVSGASIDSCSRVHEDNRSAIKSNTNGMPSHEANPQSQDRRSFLLWWFIGDLGLDTRSALEALASDPKAPPTTHFLWMLCAECLGFCSFCLVHFVDLVYETASFLSMTFWFLRWLVLNLLGKTVLSRCVIDAYRLIRAEWSFVAAEDHEDRQHLSKGQLVEGQSTPAGLSKWQVMRGIVELICLQAVTRERWIREGAGLREVKGWQKTGVQANDHESEESSDSEEEESDLIITRRDADILEFTRTPRVRPRGGHGSGDESSGGYFAGVEPGDGKTTRKGRSLVKKLKWASRLAIGAYGLHVHIVDLPPTFTPSGNRFTRQTFAHLSRLSNPDDVLHADIQQMTGDEYAYQPTFYVARDHVRKMIVVAVRGTQSFSDIIADLDMRTEKFPLPDNVDEAAQLTCHAGVLRAAQGLVKAESSLFSTVSKALEEHEDFGLTLVGHSLGAAIASAIAMLLGHYDGRDEQDSNAGAWQIRQNCGLPAGRPIQAVSLASPATFSAALSARAAMGTVPLVTSVVLGADIIPRAGHGQARELRRVLGALSRVRRRLTEKQMQRRRSSFGVEADTKKKDDVSLSAFEDARVHVLRSWWKWRSLKKIPPRDITRSETQQRDRIEAQLWRLRCDVEADLYTAVKQRAAMHRDQTQPASSSSSSTFNIPPSPWVGPQSSAPLHQLAERRQALDSATLQSEAALGGVLIPAGKCFYLEHMEEAAAANHQHQEGAGKGSSSRTRLYEIESPASFFSLPEFVTTLFASHLPASYEAVIEEM